jgi:hypothetical protein
MHTLLEGTKHTYVEEGPEIEGHPSWYLRNGAGDTHGCIRWFVAYQAYMFHPSPSVSCAWYPYTLRAIARFIEEIGQVQVKG